MSVEQRVYDISREAAADFYTVNKQFYIVKIDTNGRAALAGAGEGDGFLQNKPKQYEAASVRRVGISKVVCGGTIATAAPITSDANGKAATATSGQRYCGIALEAGASGRVISALVEFGNAI